MPALSRISILGCGWYGLALGKSLHAAGYQVKGSTTTPEKLAVLAAENIMPYFIQFEPGEERWEASFFDCDVLFLAIPPKVKQEKAADYLLRLQRMVEVVRSQQVKQVVFIGSTGIYGDHHQRVDERTAPQPTSEGGKALQEAETFLYAQPGFTTTVLRFGGLIGPGRDPGRFFAGKKEIPNGKAPVNLIHLNDCVAISHALLEKQAFGRIYNVCSPQHPEKALFYSQAALHAGLELPAFRDELLEWKIVESIYVKELLDYSIHSIYPYI